MKGRSEELTDITVTRLDTLHPCFDRCKVPTGSLSVVLLLLLLLLFLFLLFLLLLLFLFLLFLFLFCLCYCCCCLPKLHYHCRSCNSILHINMYSLTDVRIKYSIRFRKKKEGKKTKTKTVLCKPTVQYTLVSRHFYKSRSNIPS